MELFMDTVRNVVIYLLFVTIVMNLTGNSVWKKYIGVFTGIVLILILLKPVMKLFDLEESFDYYTYVNRFQVSAQDLNDQFLLAEEAGREAVLSEYEKEMEKQVEKVAERYGYTVTDFRISCGESRENLGMLTGLSLLVTGLGDPMEPEAIRIEEITAGGENPEPFGPQPDPDGPVRKAKQDMELGEMKKELAGIYSMEEERITIKAE